MRVSYMMKIYVLIAMATMVALTIVGFARPAHAASVEIRKTEQDGDQLETNILMAATRAFKKFGINATEQSALNSRKADLFIEATKIEEGEREVDVDVLRTIQDYFFKDLDVNLDVSWRTRKKTYVMYVAVRGEVWSADGTEHLTTEVAEGGAYGVKVTEHEFVINGYVNREVRDEEGLRKAVDRLALDRAMLALAGQLAPYLGGVSPAQPVVHITTYAPPTARTTPAPISVPQGSASTGFYPNAPAVPAGWRSIDGPLDGFARTNADLWLPRPAPIKIGGQVRGYVLASLGGGQYRVVFDPAVRLGPGERVNLVIDPP